MNKVVIKKNVWIGMNVTVSPSSFIGEGAIIGLGTRVYGNIPKLAIIGSDKTKIIKYRDESHYNKLENNQLYAKEEGLSLK
jgi:maltose O-acetyltransferase